jgi:hypothetical protein
MNLREAAKRTQLSITTLRRYIRSGKLHAEKSNGRYGPEYLITERDLADSGMTVRPPESSPPGSLKKNSNTVPAPAVCNTVHLSLYQELQMKHEQLLVQYGMVRVGGLRVMELQSELETACNQAEEYSREISRLKEKLANETAQARKYRQEAELELQGKSLEIAALQEKVQGLEMLMRNAVTNETIEQQVKALMTQAHRVGKRPARSRESLAGLGHALKGINKPDREH